MRTVTLLSGGVGGARLARGLAALPDLHDLTILVNVGDDEDIYGLHVSPDLDTVTYTLAGIEGPYGWGIADDTFMVMDRMAALGVDTTFRLGDADLATCLIRTSSLAGGATLSEVTHRFAAGYGLTPRLLPVTDDRLRTVVDTTTGERLSFQDYFVLRGHRDQVAALHYRGAAEAAPAPGVMSAITGADLVVIAPSNPPLSIWPILAVAGIRKAVSDARVAAVSPLFGGRALKGPADRVMAALGLPPGNAGVLAAYEGLLDLLVVDRQDADDIALSTPETRVVAADTRIGDPAAAARFAAWLVEEAA
ncbi:MAG: 2-phospho-L-lactate transferase [Actinobacteria bacterium]|nr:2-phospho-L-lactate transferase [Actinomycetota bacterium]